MLEDKPFNQVVVARLRDFFLPGARWFRGLWDVGPVLSLRELLEASEAAANGVVSDAALGWLCSDLGKTLLNDVGVPPAARQHFKQCLSSAPRLGAPEWFSLQDLAAEVDEEYLLRWAAAIDGDEAGGADGKRPVLKPERTARAIASHLLDMGFSQIYLSNWLTQETKSAKVWSLADLVRQLHRLAQVRPLSYSVLVPVTTGLNPAEAPDDWLPAPRVKALLTATLPGVERLRYAGGWRLQIEQRDPYSAAQAAFDEVERRAARLLVGRGQRMASIGQAYVFGEPVPVTVKRHTTVHRVRVRSIEQQKQLFLQTPPSQVDAAFELLAQIDGSSALAVAAGWAAIEALLVGQQEEKVIAAHRLATLVAASFPRAELTSLAAQQVRDGTALGRQLHEFAANRDRAELMASKLTEEPGPDFEHWTDRAAVARMRQMLAAPAEKLADVLSHAERAFRRLYRHRNLVLHWGKTSPVALQACLRTATPLLAAGVDRIAHAWFVQRLTPVELASRAKSRLDLAGRPGRSLPSLLEGL